MFLDAHERGMVGFGHQIEFTLVRDAKRATEPFGQQATGGARSLNGKVEQAR